MDKKINSFYFAAIFIFIFLSIILSFAIFFVQYSNPNSATFEANSTLILSVTLIIAFINYKVFEDLLSPSVIMSIVWIIPLFVSTLDFEFLGGYSFFNDKVSLEICFIFINSILLFSLGCFFNYKKFNLIRYNSNNILLEWNDKRANFLILITFLIGLIAYSYAISLKGIPILSADIINDRDNFRPDFWGNFFVYSIICIVLIVIKYSFKGFKKINTFHLFILITSLLLIIISTARVDLIYAVIVSSVVYLKIKQKINKDFNYKKTLLQFSIIILFFGLVFQRIGDLRGINKDSITYVDANPIVATFLAYGGPTAIKNFQRVVEGKVQIPETKGAFTLRPILWYVGFREMVDLQNNFVGPNTATWLYEYFCDFGFFGIIFIPLILGIIAQYFYMRMNRTKSIFPIITYGFIVVFIIISVNNDRFFGVSNTVFLLGFLPIYWIYNNKLIK